MKQLIYLFITFLLLCGCFSSHDPVDTILVFVHDTVRYTMYDTINDTIIAVDTFYVRDTVIKYVPIGHSGGCAW